MAKNNDQQNAPVNLDAILADLLPAELKVSDLDVTGGLTPLFNPKLAFERKLVVAGRIHIIDQIPVKDADRPRLCIKVCDLTAPTTGTQGDKTNLKEIEVKKGGEILIPLSGNLKSNRQLVEAVMDVEHVYFGVFAVTGVLPMKGKNDMWIYDCRIALSERKKREGKYTLPVSYARAMAAGDVARAIKGEFPVTDDGTSFDPATGEVVSAPRLASATA